jgi:IS30 family transposase
MAQSPLSLHEREEISVALTLNPDESRAVIGRQLERYPTTIWREIGANGNRYRLASEQEPPPSSASTAVVARTAG